MAESELNIVSETLYVPLLGRIYASKHYPKILYDEAALYLYEKLPGRIITMSGQNEYTYLASAVRSKNIDYDLAEFLNENPDGTVINIGCGLETLYHRNDNGRALWFELDLPEVLQLRSEYFPAEERDRYLPYSMFDYAWIDAVKMISQKPVMVVASGLFYYFSKEQVIDFIRHLTGFPHVQLIFDAVSSAGMKGTRHYMKKMNKKDAEMFFSVDRAAALASEISPAITEIKERKFYSMVDLRSDLKFMTKLKIFYSDRFSMVKMIHFKIQ